MACTFSVDDLSCPVCLCVFTEPLTLACGHSFCRGCITGLSSCPQCRAVLPGKGELERLVTNHTLKSLAEKAKERPRNDPGAEEQLLCPEHDERLKLFCLTDQRLACIICRDGEAHHGHKFKPIREAAASLRRDVDLGLVSVESQIAEIQNLRRAQSREVSKAKEQSVNLQSQIQQQFETLHQHLRKREDEIMNELKTTEADAVQKMSQSLSAMERAEDQRTEQRKSWTRLMQVTDPEMFLTHWSEERCGAALKDVFKGPCEGLSVVQSPPFQGPFQSHLQFFMWKELLQVVNPRADLLTLRDDNSCLTVSADKRSFHYAPQSWRQEQGPNLGTPQRSQSGFTIIKATKAKHRGLYDSPLSNYGSLFDSGLFDSAPTIHVPPTFSLLSTNEFSSGQHYWEVEVGLRSFWCVGVTDHFLKYESGKYFSCQPHDCSEVGTGGALRRVGVYLNCSCPGVSFYDADSMVRLVTLDCRGLVLPVSAYFNVQLQEPDTDPVSVCRY